MIAADEAKRTKLIDECSKYKLDLAQHEVELKKLKETAEEVRALEQNIKNLNFEKVFHPFIWRSKEHPPPPCFSFAPFALFIKRKPFPRHRSW